MHVNNATVKVRAVQISPLILAVLVTGIYIFFFERGVLRTTGGVFSYPLDDTFIHMAIGKNLAFHNTWSINPGEFESASSSLLYSWLLAFFFKVITNSILVPFIINCAAGFFLLLAIDKWLMRQQISVTGRSLILLAVVFFAPLPIMIILGMEHTLQCLFCFLFIITFSDSMSKIRSANSLTGWKLSWQIVLYAFLVTTIRFEGIFLVGIACLVLLYYRKLGAAFWLGLVAALPIIIFGLFSMGQGSYFLPNSVLLKSDALPFSLYGLGQFIKNILVFKLTIFNLYIKPSLHEAISLICGQRLLIFLPLIYLFFAGVLKKKVTYSNYLFILTTCTLIHLSLAASGWFFRYEAYLIVSAVSILSVIFYKYGSEFTKDKSVRYIAMITILGFAILFPFFVRSFSAFSIAKQSCVNIFEQQYQSAQFLNKYFNNTIIAANDIGAISYYNDIEVIDLIGLGSIEVARSKKGSYCTSGFLDSLLRRKGVKLAIVYDDAFKKSLLDRWVKVGSWEIPNNIICASPIVNFYVMNALDKNTVANDMKDFQKSMPMDIKVLYY
jgi:hypothetical protein